jgi:hypothetical protein
MTAKRRRPRPKSEPKFVVYDSAADRWWKWSARLALVGL